MASSSDEAALAAARYLAASCAAIIGASSRSVILHGSLASGEFRPGRSDIDPLVVMDGKLSSEQALIGADPRDVIAPVPAEWVRERGRHWLATWRSHTDDAEDAMHMVLTACRIWHYAAEGAHCAKAQAARWALERDSSLTAVRQALRRYTVDPATPISEAGIAHVLDVVLRETAASGGPDR